MIVDVQKLTELSKVLIDAARAYETVRVAMNQERGSNIFVPALNIATEATREFES